MQFPTYFSFSSLPLPQPLSSHLSHLPHLSLPSLSSLRASLAELPSRNDIALAFATLRERTKMLSIATLFDDEQRLLNRLWIVLLGLQALLVLVGTISAIVRAVVAMRRSSRANKTGILTNTRRGGLRRTGASPWQYPRRVTIELPATVYEFSDEKSGYSYGYDYDQHYEYDAYDDGYTEAYNNYGNYDEYASFEKYSRVARSAASAHFPGSPSSKV